VRFPAASRCGQWRSTPMSGRSVISSQYSSRLSLDHQALTGPASLSPYEASWLVSRTRGGLVETSTAPGEVRSTAPMNELRWCSESALTSTSPDCLSDQGQIAPSLLAQVGRAATAPSQLPTKHRPDSQVAASRARRAWLRPADSDPVYAATWRTTAAVPAAARWTKSASGGRISAGQC
jgi:hypothetical protein